MGYGVCAFSPYGPHTRLRGNQTLYIGYRMHNPSSVNKVMMVLAPIRAAANPFCKLFTHHAFQFIKYCARNNIQPVRGCKFHEQNFIVFAVNDHPVYLYPVFFTIDII